MKNTEPIFDVIEKLLIFVFDLSEITEKLTNDISELNNKINQKSNLPTPPKIKKPAFNVPLPPQSSNHQKTQPVPQAQPMPMNLRTEMQKELKDAFARMRKQQDE